MSFSDRECFFILRNTRILTYLRPGAFVISTFLPLLCYAFTFLCNDISGCPTPSLLHPSSLDWEQLKKEVGWPGFSGLVTWNAVLGNFAYYFLSLALYAFLPADEPEGTELRSGGRLKYRFNCKFLTSICNTIHSNEPQLGALVSLSWSCLQRAPL